MGGLFATGLKISRSLRVQDMETDLLNDNEVARAVQMHLELEARQREQEELEKLIAFMRYED
jgi:hypothetical protein